VDRPNNAHQFPGQDTGTLSGMCMGNPDHEEITTMSFSKDMKIRKKLIGGFLILVLILVVVAAAGYTRIGETE